MISNNKFYLTALATALIAGFAYGAQEPEEPQEPVLIVHFGPEVQNPTRLFLQKVAGIADCAKLMVECDDGVHPVKVDGLETFQKIANWINGHMKAEEEETG